MDETLDLIKRINTNNEYNPLVDFLIPLINEQNGLESMYPDLDLLEEFGQFFDIGNVRTKDIVSFIDDLDLLDK